MWPGVSSSRPISFGHVAPDLVGLRDVFLVAPASSFHHHHNHNETLMPDPHSLNANSNNPATTALGVGMIPLLGGGIQLWHENQHQQQHQPQQHHQQHEHNYLKKHALAVEHDNGDAGITALVTGSGGGTATCQDCGNQAKKDCGHRRCRSCCKSRGFDCPTHVKSTWVPAARRRERQIMAERAAAAGSSASTSGHAKKPRLVASQTTTTTTTSHTSTSNTTPPRSFETSSSHQDASFKESLPRHVRAPAVFKCVRVTAVDGGEDEFAYQALVKIGGHVFKGLLYNQGALHRDGYPDLSDLHLGGGGGRNGISSSSPMMDPTDVYAASGGGGFLGGSSTYGNPIN